MLEQEGREEQQDETTPSAPRHYMRFDESI